MPRKKERRASTTTTYITHPSQRARGRSGKSPVRSTLHTHHASMRPRSEALTVPSARYFWNRAAQHYRGTLVPRTMVSYSDKCRPSERTSHSGFPHLDRRGGRRHNGGRRETFHQEGKHRREVLGVSLKPLRISDLRRRIQNHNRPGAQGVCGGGSNQHISLGSSGVWSRSITMAASSPSDKLYT